LYNVIRFGFVLCCVRSIEVEPGAKLLLSS
jgi:hypothetical protein